MDPLQFTGNDPGAVTLGNFINYYDFHPPEERMKLLPHNIWPFDGSQCCMCLDIGCNTGELTIKVYEHIFKSFQENSTSLGVPVKSCSMLGIDIDPVLIERAQERNCHGEQVTFKCVDFMSDRRDSDLQEYLTKSSGQFDVIFCFSVTMWIHLNHGDDGLNKFLTDIAKMGRMIVIEPQPWKCYKSAEKRLKRCQRSFPNFQKLSIRENVEQHIELFLQNCNFLKIHESIETKWGRKLLFFTNMEKNN